ncbi:hypothetical protein ACWT_3259 [Actinoplanes sp. SE50]|uniref:DUF2785 domain-containing protein n=1 Tax=unclassified Actinoplanes TaxID=2626549 RepID=UPI00023ECB1A|nr:MULTISPECIES: DUF2785 domain-containing protein [unclassified Actinoplanes]AEV84282.1 hypothetical protein ACPL_3387 [Actinoplanes sp. SE50/110]ATO82674.1 hypothetical protein ACWT_3259 [Actinoplanes sp. SE50]SLM00081.1 hypothetical protein ACSP50_3313 [Actinoplanes sp. SE50/110]
MSDTPIPADLDEALAGLLDMLAAPDPRVRDDQAYSTLVRWIRGGALDTRLTALGDMLAGRLVHPEIQARAFAPLVLAAIVDRDRETGVLDRAAVHRWRAAFGDWWLTEDDLRGWDERLGWLHAIAHGADLAGALGTSPRLDAAALAALLDLIGRRTVTPTAYRYAQMEEDRTARALVRILGRPELTEEGAVRWLIRVDELFDGGGPGPLPIPVANTLAVLRALYVMADRHALPHRTAITDATAVRLHAAFDAYPVDRSSP